MAREDDAIVFADVFARRGTDKGIPDDGGVASREEREIAAAIWLPKHTGDKDFTNLPVRFDSIAMIVLSENRAMLRYHINRLDCEITTGETD